MELFEEATSIKTGGSPRIALRAAIAWVDAAYDYADPSTIRAFRTAMEILERVSASGSSLKTRHYRLITTFKDPRLKNLAAGGAAYAINSGDIELALELLEQGRNVLLTEAGRYRTPIDNVEALDSNLAEKFKAISRRMDHSMISGESVGESRPVVDTVAK